MSLFAQCNTFSVRKEKSRTPGSPRDLFVEPLEGRSLLAGNVLATSF